MDAEKGPSRFDRVMLWLMPRITPLHVWAYRKFKGRVGATTTAGGPVLVLTTTGRTTGMKRSVALGYYYDGEHVYVVGSNGGLSMEPNWALNLKANPTVEVQIGENTSHTVAELLQGRVRDDAWAAYTAAYPDYAAAEAWSGRKFPVFRLQDVIIGDAERT